MAYYNVCPKCGFNLDPCEKCDCEEEKEKKIKELEAHYIKEKGSKQLIFNFREGMKYEQEKNNYKLYS